MLGWVRAVSVCVPGMSRLAFILFSFGAVEGRSTIPVSRFWDIRWGSGRGIIVSPVYSQLWTTTDEPPQSNLPANISRG